MDSQSDSHLEAWGRPDPTLVLDPIPTGAIDPKKRPKRIYDADRDAFDKRGKVNFEALAEQTARTVLVDGRSYSVIDLHERFTETAYTKILLHMYNQLPEVHINYKNGPCFLNFEKRLPVDDSPGRYIEAYYCGGGSRLVYDNATGTSFVSAHYSSFHVLSNGSSPVLHNSQSFLLEATALYQALQSAKWTAMERLFPASVKLLTGKTRPAPPAAGEKDPPSQTT